MLKISDLLHKMVRNDQRLEYFVSNKLLNLSKFAKHIKPNLESQMEKELSVPTIVMALSRLQKKITVTEKQIEFKVRQFKLHSDLCTLTYNKSESTHREVQELYNKSTEQNVYFTISESSTEITFITKKEFLLQQSYSEPQYAHFDLSAISIQFDPKYLTTPGIITTILQRLTLVNVNFIEIASTCTEMTIYINQRDMKLAFDTLHDSFLSKR